MRSWDSILNSRLRAQLRGAFAREARAAAAPMAARAMDQLWGRIDARLPAEPHRSPARGRRLVGPGWLAAGAGLAATAVLVGVLAGPGALPPDPAGLKGPASGAGSLASLRYAVVTAQRTVLPGREGMGVPLGSPLIFSVESEGVSSEQPLQADLAYIRWDPQGLAGKPVRIARTSLTHSRETLMRGDDFLAFTPEAVGVYEFFLRTAAPQAADAPLADGAAAAGGAHDVRVRVRIVAP